MLRRETERDDRQGNERGRGGNGEGGRLRKGVPVAAAVLAVLLLRGRERRERIERIEPAADTGGRTPLADLTARVRERVAPDAEAPVPEREPTPGPATEVATDLRRSVRRVAGDERVRKGTPLAAALLAGALLAGGRESDEATATEADAETADEIAADEGTESEEAAAVPAVDAMYRSAPSADEAVEEKRERRAEASAEGDGESGDDATTAAAAVDATEPAGIDAEADGLVPPTVRGMPMLGLGTYQDADYDECLESVRRALDIGYRHLDATERREAYYNEEAVGEAVSESYLDREELFVATKVDPNDLESDHVRRSVEESLDRLDMEYLDLLYVHWPTGEYDAEETLSAFAEVRQEGLTEEIGVSNFTIELLEEAIEVSDAPIFANQVEMHPLLPQEELREFCERQDIEVVAYSPIARGDVEDVDELQEVAAKHGVTPEQVSLAWLREKGVTAVPESTSEAHLRENWLSLGLDLDMEDMLKLDSIEERHRIVDPDDAPWNR